MKVTTVIHRVHLRRMNLFKEKELTSAGANEDGFASLTNLLIIKELKINKTPCYLIRQLGRVVMAQVSGNFWSIPVRKSEGSNPSVVNCFFAFYYL